MKVCTVEEMRALDGRAITEYGIPEHLLMENAGEAAYYAILREIGVRGLRFAVVCGLGNNGGDGFVVARKLRSSGARVRVLILGDPERYGESARLHFDVLRGGGAEISVEPTSQEVAAALADADVIVDAVFGTGLTREVEGRFREAIDAINAAGSAGRRVVSLDIPSGVNGDTGLVHGVAVRADLTVTFGLPKLGNLFFPGAELGGRLLVSHISYPPELVAAPEVRVEVSAPPPLPPRPPDGHKGTFGDALFIAGARNYYGAPTFAALAFLKAGGGYSRLAAPASVIPYAAGIAPEVVFAPQAETETGGLALEAREVLLELAGAVDFVVLGPGLSLAQETQELVRVLLPAIDRPLLVDGDGLTAVAAELQAVRRRTAPTVLTPHPGEMARLTGLSVSEIRADRVGVVRRTAAELGAIIVLKGARSLVGLPDGRVFVNPTGNSGMASAGSGDVLTGTIAAMAGLGLTLEDAVPAGVYLHGLAGDLAARAKGEDGITARDILEHLPAAVRTYREEYEALVGGYAGILEVI